MRATLVLLLVAMLAVAAACGAEERGAGGTSTGSSEPPSAPAPDSSETLYEASAMVLDAGTPMLCVGAIAESLPPQCGDVPIANWDWEAVDGEESSSGTTWGDYHVIGTYDGETFTVTEVGPVENDQATDGSESDFSPACPEPEGGWVIPEPETATQEQAGEAEGYAGSQPDYVASWITHLEPPDSGGEALGPVVYNAVFTRDAARHEAGIREVWTGPLCVVAREVRSAAELAGIREEAEAYIQEELGLHFLWSQEGDVGLAAEIGVVVDVDGAGQAALDDRYGAGMVRLFPALRPVE